MVEVRKVLAEPRGTALLQQLLRERRVEIPPAVQQMINGTTMYLKQSIKDSVLQGIMVRNNRKFASADLHTNLTDTAKHVLKTEEGIDGNNAKLIMKAVDAVLSMSDYIIRMARKEKAFTEPTKVIMEKTEQGEMRAFFDNLIEGLDDTNAKFLLQNIAVIWRGIHGAQR